MNKNQFILILMVIIGTSSCKNDTVQYPITYSSGLVTEQSIKVYTKDGEITSSNVVNSVLNRYEYNFSDIQIGHAGRKLVATYLSEDSVELTIDNIKEKKLRVVHEKDGIIYWESQDTSFSGLSSVFSIENLYKYHPFYYQEYKKLPPDGLYLTNTKFKECYYILRDGGKLNIPMIEFVLIHYGYDKGFSSLGINNAFSNMRLADLYAKDTILIQQYLIEMK